MDCNVSPFRLATSFSEDILLCSSSACHATLMHWTHLVLSFIVGTLLHERACGEPSASLVRFHRPRLLRCTVHVNTAVVLKNLSRSKWIPLAGLVAVKQEALWWWRQQDTVANENCNYKYLQLLFTKRNGRALLSSVLVFASLWLQLKTGDLPLGRYGTRWGWMKLAVCTQLPQTLYLH